MFAAARRKCPQGSAFTHHNPTNLFSDAVCKMSLSLHQLRLQGQQTQMGFGKYADQTYLWVYNHDRGYFYWARRQHNPGGGLRYFLEWAQAYHHAAGPLQGYGYYGGYNHHDYLEGYYDEGEEEDEDESEDDDEQECHECGECFPGHMMQRNDENGTLVCEDCFDEMFPSDAEEEEDDGEVEVTGSRTREERDAEGRANAIDVEKEGEAGTSGVDKTKEEEEAEEDDGTRTPVKSEEEIKVKVEVEEPEEPATQPSERRRGKMPVQDDNNAPKKRVKRKLNGDDE